MPSPTSSTSNPSSPTPATPPPKVGMVSAVKFSVFKGVGNEELGKFWLVVRVVWESQGITDDNIKKATLVSVLQDRVLTWYIKYSSDHPNARIEAIQDTLKKEFGRPKSET